MDKRNKEILVSILHRDNKVDLKRLHLVENIVNIDNSNFELSTLYNVLKYANEGSEDELFNALLRFYGIDEAYVLILTRLFKSETKNERLNFVIDSIANPTVFKIFEKGSIKLSSVLEEINDIERLAKHNSYNSILDKLLDVKLETLQSNTLLLSFLDTIRSYPDLESRILDSYSDNQFLSKTALLNAVDNLDILNKDSEVTIWGGWFGSIIIPKLSDKVSKIYNIDTDGDCLRIAKNYLLKDYTNIEYYENDVFDTYRECYKDTNLIINTSCEHMPPMKEWPWFAFSSMDGDNIDIKYKRDDLSRKKVYVSPRLSNNCYFAFQSNNMFGIEGHINCVNSITEFKEQLPERAEVLFEEEVKDTRGTRYMLVGKLNTL